MSQSSIKPVKYIQQVLAWWVLTVNVVMAAPVQTQGLAELELNIPRQSLQTAISQLSENADLEISYPANLVKGLTSPALNGRYTAKEALGKLLAGTGLALRVAANNEYTIVRVPDSEGKADGLNMLPVVQVTADKPSDTDTETTLPKVTVEADAEYDPEYYTDPYNKDYVIPNATSGTKTDTPIMETPLNVQVISKQVLKDQQVINLGQALKNVSGVTTSTTGANGNSFAGGNTQAITLRGFPSQTFFRNGFRLQQGSASREMANIESVEVLKGSAAILYGQVEPGGMVNVVTKQPLSTPYYGFSQQFGSYNLYRTTVDATGPITKNKELLYRMNMSYENSGSFRDFVSKEDVFLAPVFKWNISPKTQATFELEYNHNHVGQDSAFVPLIDGKILNMPRNRNYGEYSPATTETFFGGVNWSHQFNDDWSIKHRFSVNQTKTVGRLIIPALVDLGNSDVMRILWGVGETNLNTYSTNLDLIGHFDTAGLHHTLLLGGDYYKLDTIVGSFNDAQVSDPSLIKLFNPVHPGTPFVNPNPLPNEFVSNHTDQFGLYAQDQIKLPYNVHVMGGIRYQYIHQNTLSKAPDGSITDSGVSTNDAVTPRVGILWQPQSWLSLYANYLESFGANTDRVFPNKLPPPSSAEQYEGGIKTEFFGGRLRATLAYYDLTKTNVPTTDRSHPNYSILTGAVRSRGPELDIQGEILPGWNLIATYSNTDIRIAKSNNGDVGQRFFGVPRNTGTIWSTYEVQDGDLRGLKFGGGVTLSNGTVACCPGSSAPKLPGYATVDLLAAYSLDVGKSKFTAQLNINNLLDKHYYPNLSTGFDANSSYADFGQPRTFMGSVNIQY
jgi:iron complex outermembrane recepter protein